MSDNKSITIKDSILENTIKNDKQLSILLVSEILKYCWNDKYGVFAWKVSLSLISKKVFKIISGFANQLDLTSPELYQHLKNPHCIFKEIDSLSTSFKFLEGYIDEFNFEILDKKNIYLPKECSIENIENDKIQDPLSLLSSLTIRGPAASYVKKEKLVLQLLLSSNTGSFKHFSMISHKNTLLKNLFSYLDQCPNLQSFGLGLPLGNDAKKTSGLAQFLKKSAKNLKRLHLCFHFKSSSPPSTEESKQLNQALFGDDSEIEYQKLETLELGHKKLSGPNYDSHSFDYPTASSDILFKCLSDRSRLSSLTTLIFHKPSGFNNTPEATIEFLNNFNSYINAPMSASESLTNLELPIKINRLDILKAITSKKSLRRLTILTNQMCAFTNDSLDTLELLSDTHEKDTQEASELFFEFNHSLPLKHLIIRDHIFFEACKPFLADNTTLESLNVALKGRTNFGLQNNPFLSIPDAKALKKMVAKFPHIEKGDIADAISRFLRFCSMSDSIQFVKYIQIDFDSHRVNSFDFRFLNRNDRSYYYTRSLPKNDDPNKVLICTDLKTWNGIDDQYDIFKLYVTKSRKLFDQLVEQCKTRPGYNAPYLLKYTKNCLSTFSKEQWENSDEILKTAHQVVLAILDSDTFSNNLVEKAHMNSDFLKKTANYIFYGMGPTAKPVPLELLNRSLNNINNQNNQNINNNNINTTTASTTIGGININDNIESYSNSSGDSNIIQIN